ncbi:MAG TPA: C4-dicarboxylic acid transporter DauA [Polyangia bacterium]|nr:C4-dicarboxylic acid transporter DauA [Polyangia bacterium]
MARTRYQSSLGPIRAKDLPAAALRATLREGYRRADFRADVLAGLVVGIVALPLAMALAIAVGAAPQHGLYTAIVAGAVVAALGGSRMQVTGPTAAFIVILAPIYTKFGMAGLLVSGVMGGLILIAMGLGRLGQLIEFIPHPVTTGFTAGIATVIATLQIKDVFGLHLTRTPETFFDRIAAMWQARGSASVAELAVAAITLALLIAVPKATKRVPAPLIAIPIAGCLAAIVNHAFPGHNVATIASRFHATVGGHVVAGVPPLPPLPVWPWRQPGPGGVAFELSFTTLRELLSGAFAVAMLGGIESLLSAVIADGMAGTKHDPDAELLALGIGNVVTPFLGGIPATGAIARTATNIRSGARSPIAAIVHAVTVLAAVIVLAPLIGYLPMAGLAALLLLVAWNMSEVKHFGHVVRVAPRSDVLVLLTCFTLTVVFDMVVAVSVGVVLAALLFMRRMAEITHARLTEDEPESGSFEIPADLKNSVALYDVAGALFFGAAQKAMGSLGTIANRVKVLIIRLDHVPVMDATGLVALESALATLSKHGCATVLSGLQRQPSALIQRAALAKRPWRVLIRPDFPSALVAARELVQETKGNAEVQRSATGG